ncbi:hypothetical protein PYJP_09100 [Pyrofollis japonicus]|uniref:hypothetical protein n=1 Tax=Pyrofollis japonicus TaxID=3060460 RepID=UPI00295C12DD|nr:hypothetical protein [Pyrofollis japonicus]BEP17558.1 hypothetical protein PYJP_09100 [Pyrofollis japonicus]
MQLLKNQGKFDVAYDIVAPDISLGGTGNQTKYSMNFNLYHEPSSVKSAFLDLAVLVKDLSVRRWKISIADVVLTREFKPQNCRKISNGYVCKLVFDVTPIIKSKMTDEYNVEINYLELKELTLLHIGLLTVYNDENASSKYIYVVEPIVIEANRSISIDIDQPMSEANIKMSIYLPHASAKLLIKGDGYEKALTEYRGTIEYTGQVGSIKTLMLSHIGNATYLPREIIIPAMLIYETTAPKPVIDVRMATRREYDTVSIEIRNSGEKKVTNMIVVSISLGNIIERKIIDELNPGETKVINVKINPEALTTIRVIWKHKGENFIREIKVRSS